MVLEEEEEAVGERERERERGTRSDYGGNLAGWAESHKGSTALCVLERAPPTEPPKVKVGGNSL